MDLSNIPSKKIKVYYIDPNQLNNFYFEPDLLTTMVSPNFKMFNQILSRACTGLSETKKYSADKKLVCYRKFGFVQKFGWDRGNKYCNERSAFEILDAQHIPLIDQDNLDGLAIMNDFLDLKLHFINRYDKYCKFRVDHLKTSLPRTIEIANAIPISLGVADQPYYITSERHKIQGHFQNSTTSVKNNIQHPLNLTFEVGDKFMDEIQIHPTIHAGRTNKTHVDYKYGTYNKIMTKNCLTEIDLNTILDPCILKYNDIVEEFNKRVEELKDKYLALYMLHSIGRKESTI